MTDNLLISREDIAKYKQISNSAEKGRIIDQYILEAQIQDIASLVGEKIYNELLFEPEKHELLLDGGEYIHEGRKFNCYGLKVVLIHFAWARYVRFGSYVDTPYSMVQKRVNESEPVSTREKDSIYTNSRDTAIEYYRNVERYMIRAGLIKASCCGQPNKPIKSKYTSIKTYRR